MYLTEMEILLLLDPSNFQTTAHVARTQAKPPSELLHRLHGLQDRLTVAAGAENWAN